MMYVNSQLSIFDYLRRRVSMSDNWSNCIFVDAKHENKCHMCHMCHGHAKKACYYWQKGALQYS